MVPVWRSRGIGQRADAKCNKHENAMKGVNRPRRVVMVQQLCEGQGSVGSVPSLSAFYQPMAWMPPVRMRTTTNPSVTVSLVCGGHGHGTYRPQSHPHATSFQKAHLRNSRRKDLYLCA